MTQEFVSENIFDWNLCLKSVVAEIFALPNVYDSQISERMISNSEICVWELLWLNNFLLQKFLTKKFVINNIYDSKNCVWKHMWLKYCLQHVWLKNFSIKPFFFSIQLCDLKFYIWTHFLLKSLTQMLICVAKICQ